VILVKNNLGKEVKKMICNVYLKGIRLLTIESTEEIVDFIKSTNVNYALELHSVRRNILKPDVPIKERIMKNNMPFIDGIAGGDSKEYLIIWSSKNALQEIPCMYIKRINIIVE
jgi:hypothetical protein